MLTVTPKDALRSESLPPGWQICIVENHYVKPAGTDGSANHHYELVVTEGQWKGVPLQELIVNEKAVSMNKQFFIACGAPENIWLEAKKGNAQGIDEKAPVGKIIKVMVKPEAYQGRMLNKPIDFLAMDKTVMATV